MDEKIIKKMRRFLDEVIPEGGGESDTRFSDEDLWEIYEEYQNVYKSVSVGWTEKAGMIAAERGNYDEYHAGNERYKYVNLTTAINAALAMAKQYDALYKQEQEQNMSGLIMKFRAPDVI